MIAYYFRTVDKHGEPTGWMGMVVAQSKEELFWGIDEFCDPYSVEIMTARRGGYCRRIEIDGDEHFSHDHEISECEPLIDDDTFKWRKPKWNVI